MPGFTSPNSAAHAGVAGNTSTAETKRQHRWIFTVFWQGEVANLDKASAFLQKAQRPHAVTEDVLMHHDEEQVHFAGKYHWEPLSLVFYDTVSPFDTSGLIYEWFNKVVQVPTATVATPTEYKKRCQLDMTDGAGSSIEKWGLYNCWPLDVNWNDLDYTNTEIATVDVTMVFDRAILE